MNYKFYTTWSFDKDTKKLAKVCIYDKSERENMTLDEIREVLIESGLAE